MSNHNDGNGNDGNDNNNRAACDCDCLFPGDVVEHKMNTNVFGIVIGFSGSLISVRLSPNLAVVQFHEFELRKLDGDDEYRGGDEDDVPDEDNVINFTQAVDLRKAKAKGAA